jgi:lysophospholipase L1-like esterase
MKCRPCFVAVLSALIAAPAAAQADVGATTYDLSLGDSLAAGTNATAVGVPYTHLGYADLLHATLAVTDPKLKLVKLGCPGESTASMRFGSQPPTTVLSCGTPAYYKNVLYPKGTQLAEAVAFLRAHAGNVALVTIDIGANDLQRHDAGGNLVICLFEPAGCASEAASVAGNLGAILVDLRQAAGPNVPIVGTTYYDVFAPLCVGDDSLRFVCDRVDALNGLLANVYAAAGVPVADVAGAFAAGQLPQAALDVCVWTWFCVAGDTHANAIGHGRIAQAFGAALGLPTLDDTPTPLPPGCVAGYTLDALGHDLAGDQLRPYDQNHDDLVCRRSA